jgi:Scavenger mRNA decapping enzyme (DcpS) N-terminal
MSADTVVPTKIAKVDSPSVHSNLEDLRHFQLEKVLNEDSRSKTIFLQGTFKGLEGTAVVILEKKGFPAEDKVKDFFTPDCPIVNIFVNDIYGDYDCFPIDQKFTGM